MGKLKEVRIKSLADFAKHVESLLSKGAPTTAENPFSGNWYRGVGRANTYKLAPGLFRHPTLTKIEDLLKLEGRMLQDFERQGVLHDEASAGDPQTADFRRLFYMQHHGVPTRLLDWSTNPFIALYFALTTAEMNDAGTAYDEDAAVWVLDPVAWNRVALHQISHGDKGPLLYIEAMLAYGPRKLFSGDLEPTAVKTLYETPACILAAANNARMFAQRGVFTIFGRSLEPLEEQFKSIHFPSTALTKLVVPKELIKQLTLLLLRLGYTDSVSYPDLHGLAMEIRRSRGFEV